MTVPHRQTSSVASERAPIAATSARNMSPVTRRSAPLVVVVDQDRAVRSSLASLLHKLGYAVTTAADAAEATAILAPAPAPLSRIAASAPILKSAKRSSDTSTDASRGAPLRFRVSSTTQTTGLTMGRTCPVSSVVPITQQPQDRSLNRVTILNGWKEISKYVGRGVRTLQRWERDFGLPVHRPKGCDRAAVLAFPEELNAWLHSTPLRIANEQSAAPEVACGADAAAARPSLLRVPALSSPHAG